jgi:predicted site-specific integrase-resolvase
MKQEVEARIIGYARASREDQKLQVQQDYLEKFGCEEIHKEKKSGGNSAIKGFRRASELKLYSFLRWVVSQQLPSRCSFFATKLASQLFTDPHGRLLSLRCAY